MEIMGKLNEHNVDYSKIANILRAGGIIIYPTDTAYALGCDATNETAVAKIFQIKGRAKTKTLSLIAADRAMAEEWLEFSDTARALADKYWPGPLGLILPVKKNGLAAAVIQDGCAGVRVPANAIARELSRLAGVPLVATSANASGSGPKFTLAAVRASLGDKLALIDKEIDGGELTVGAVSTMVKVCDNKVEIIRQGAIKIK